MLCDLQEVTFICWLWRDRRGYLKRYAARHVNHLREMIARHYRGPHRFVCIGSKHRGLRDDVEFRPIWGALQGLGGCYRRLKVFDPMVSTEFGRWIVSIDLDCVIVDDITGLIQSRVREGRDFTVWVRPDGFHPYCGAFWMLRAGRMGHLWRQFNLEELREVKRRMTTKQNWLHSRGTDQAWINHCLDKLHYRPAVWSVDDGVHDYKRLTDCTDGELPDGARIVFFNGRRHMPDWSDVPDWVREHYPAWWTEEAQCQAG